MDCYAMILIGFIKEYNNTKESIELDTFLNSRSQTVVDMDKVLHYLEQGE
jgi:hypothetical protein